MNEFWGRVHFWCSFIFMNLVFMPMFAQGMEGMLRRMADGGANYSAARVPGAIDTLPGTIMELHTWILWAAMALGIAQIPFIINFFWSIKHGEKVTATIRGRPPRWNGRRPRRRRTAILHEPPRSLSRPLRIQRARPRHGFHAAKRTATRPRHARRFQPAH